MDEQNLDYLSEDVQEILSTPPSWVMTWGTATIVLVLFLMGIVGYFFKYPETVSGRVELTTPMPPVPVVAAEMLNIDKFFVEEGKEVEKGDLLALRDNLANWEDIMEVERQVQVLLTDKDEWVRFKPQENLKLGEISTEYYSFKNSFSKFSFTKRDRFSFQRMEQLEKKRNAAKRKQASLREKLTIAEEQLDVAIQEVEAKQYRYTVVDSSKHDLVENELYNAVRERNSKKKEIANIEQELSESYTDQRSITIEELGIQYESESSEEQTLASLEEKLQVLKSAVDNWKTKFLIRAPISGRITFFGKNSRNQVYQPNQEIVSIIPKQEEEKYVGNILLPILKTVKLKEGQEVRLKFDRYPFKEWGFVVGKVGKMTANQREEQYLIEVDLPTGLVTNKEKNIPFQYQMRGKAEVITADKRFITRMLDEFL